MLVKSGPNTRRHLGHNLRGHVLAEGVACDRQPEALELRRGPVRGLGRGKKRLVFSTTLQPPYRLLKIHGGLEREEATHLQWTAWRLYGGAEGAVATLSHLVEAVVAREGVAGLVVLPARGLSSVHRDAFLL